MPLLGDKFANDEDPDDRESKIRERGQVWQMSDVGHCPKGPKTKSNLTG